MARKLRYLPEESLVEITCRTIHGRLLLTPSAALNQVIIGVLARAQKATGMKICAFVYLSNHCHLLVRPRDAKQLAAFMRYVNSNVAREVGRLYKWREKIWGRRYTDIVVSHEPEAHLQRLRYVLEQGVKENLVASPLHWPGAHSTAHLASGEPLRGIWVDRTALYRARLRREPADEGEFTSSERVRLSPLPGWEGLSVSQRQTLIRALIRDVRREHARRRGGRRVLGRKAILDQHPHARAAPKNRSPAPRFHAVEPRVRRALEDGYRLFLLAYRQAAEQVRSGLGGVAYPSGSFPGPGRFVPLRS